MKFRIVQYKSGEVAGIPFPTTAEVDGIVITKVFGDVDIPLAKLIAYEEYEKGCCDKVAGPVHTGKEALRFIRSFCASNTYANLRTAWVMPPLIPEIRKLGVETPINFLSPDIN